MKLSEPEVAVIKNIVNDDCTVWAISPRLWREMRLVKKLGTRYPYRTTDGALSICVDFYPPKPTAAEKRNMKQEIKK